MRRYLVAIMSIALLVLVSFFVVEAFDVPLLVDPSDHLDEAGVIGAILGVVLLLLDVFIPVPSSIIMIAHGAMFGVMGGTILTLVGAVGGTMIGFLVGRRGASLVQRFVSLEEQQRADEIIDRWGILAIIVTRPIPILAETVAIMVGTTAMSWRRVFVASMLGVTPTALIYAIAGAYTTDLGSGVLVFLLVVAIAVLTWVLGRRLEGRLVQNATKSTST